MQRPYEPNEGLQTKEVGRVNRAAARTLVGHMRNTRPVVTHTGDIVQTLQGQLPHRAMAV